VTFALGRWRRAIVAGTCTGTWVLMALISSSAFADEPRPASIQFLQVQIKDGKVALLRTRVRPGTVKPGLPANHRNPLIIELATPDGKTLWTNQIADPTIEIIEVPDPTRPGEWVTREVRRNPAEMTLRVPARGDARRVRFLRPLPVSAPEKSEARDARKFELLGELVLPALSGPP
jgi:hypothetical protein